MTIFPEEIYAHILSYYTLDDCYGGVDTTTFWPKNIIDDVPFDPLFLEPYGWVTPRFGPLAEMCLVSKTFHRLLQPTLYHTHVMTRDSHSKTNTRSRLFLRSLLENPQLGRKIQNLSVEGSDGSEEDRDYVPHAPSAEMIALYEAMDLSMLPNSDRMLSLLKRGHEDAEVTLLITTCPNVRLLYVGSPSYPWTSLLWQGFCQQWHVSLPADVAPLSIQQLDIPEDQRMLGNIHTMCFRHYDSEGHADFRDLVPFMNLPRLKRIYANQASLLGMAPLFGSANVSHLEFSNSVWDLESLTSILKACPSVETLKLISGEEFYEDMEPDLATIGYALREHAKGLKRLWIDLRTTENWLQGGPEDMGYLGDLRAFTNLEYLTVHLLHLIDPADLHLVSDYEEWPKVKLPSGIDIEFEPTAGMVAAHKLLLPILPETIKQITFLEEDAPTSVVMTFKSLRSFTVKYIAD